MSYDNDNIDEIINDVQLVLDILDNHDDIHANHSRKKADIFTCSIICLWGDAHQSKVPCNNY